MTSQGEKAFRTIVVLLGGSGIAIQTLLLRELLILFGGNEFSLGAIIGNWLAAGALGALAGGRVARLRCRPSPLLALLTASLALLFPLTLLAVRLYRPLAGLPPDLALGIGQICLSSLLLLLPVGFVNGLLFVVACAAAGEESPPRSGAGRVYFLSTVGAIGGGLLTGFILVPLVSPFTTAALILLGHGLATLNYWGTRRRPVGPAGRTAALVTLLAGGLLLAGGGDRLHRLSLERQWEGKELLSWRNSPYQNIAVVGAAGGYTVYSDGLPLLALPDPDLAFVEEFAHLPLLAHPRPERLLLLGGDAGGLLGELLKHRSLRQIDCVELDPLLLATVREYALAAGRRELEEPRVRLIYEDGRRHLRETAERYDVVLLDRPLPRSLAENRFFTDEFFRLVRQRLRPGGILAVSAAGSLTYYGRELREANASLRATLRGIFPRVATVPGDVNIILASTEPAGDDLDATALAHRLRERGIVTGLITPAHLEYLLSREQRDWYETALRGERGEVNRDFSPRLLVHSLAHRTVLFSPALEPLLDRLSRLTLPAAAAPVMALTLAAGVAARRRRSAAIIWGVATTGFAGMVLELVLICAFQVFQGAMYQAAGLLITAFMGGLAGGSLLMTGAAAGEQDRCRLLGMEGGMLLLAAGMALGLSHAEIIPGATPLRVYGVIVPLLVAAGFLTGAEFPLAVRLTADDPGTEPAAAGAIYGADLLGGWLGGIVGGALLVQALGPAPACLLLALLKGGSWLVVRYGLRERSPENREGRTPRC